MFVLIAAVAASSLVGSMHCVGMCGPLAIWASGASERYSRSKIVGATVLYHVGRLSTYLIIGAIAGLAGSLVDSGGQALGIQLVAARVVGISMVVIGLARLIQLGLRSLSGGPKLRSKSGVPQTSESTDSLAPPQPSWITRQLIRLRPMIMQLPIGIRGYATGALTVLLPCGWLYLFALVAAGTGSLTMGPVVMLAFWLGTVPALTGLVLGAQALALRFRRAIPAVAALLLIAGGCFTAAGRGFAQLNSLSDIATSSRLVPNVVGKMSDRQDGSPEALAESVDVLKELDTLVNTPLPCCQEHGEPPESRQPKSDPIETRAGSASEHDG